MFKFLNHTFNPQTLVAEFSYQGTDGIIFTEKIKFHAPTIPYYADTIRNRVHATPNHTPELLDRALFLAFILIGTSYYKSHPTTQVVLPQSIDDFQARFFSTVYQEGLSQFTFENQLTRADLAHFTATVDYRAPEPLSYNGTGTLALQSGGKDSLLTATLLREQNTDFTPWFVGYGNNNYPQVIDEVSNQSPQITNRLIDHANLQKSAGLNGHVPITYIVMSIALIQAIINGENTVLTSVAQEGNEPHGMVGDLPINHQWSKSWSAEQLFARYVATYISPDLHVGSPLRKYSELKVAELFVKKCWQNYSHQFSSCNRANYTQGNDSSILAWCGDCAKCANSYLLFCPFLPTETLTATFANQDLFTSSRLTEIFKGLLGIDGVMKPFECVGTIDELRYAYHHRDQSGTERYHDLPFVVPDSDFDPDALYPTQPYFQEFFHE